jgi:hypothetical protein
MSDTVRYVRLGDTTVPAYTRGGIENILGVIPESVFMIRDGLGGEMLVIRGGTKKSSSAKL